MPDKELQQAEAMIARLRECYAALRRNMGTVVVGQEQALKFLTTGLMCGGHMLMVGVPGLAKTLMVKALAETLGWQFHRIQFTPDLMPADITGTEILQSEEGGMRRQLVFHKGPVFANLILADEINRTPPKTQAALLEAMQEYAVTTGGATYHLPQPFVVVATQNPIEQEGTYPLPEAQVDRFMMKLSVGYPSPEEELEIMRRMSAGPEPAPDAVVSPKDIVKARQVVEEIYIDPKIEQYIVDIVFATRNPKDYGLEDLGELISYGASPRASIYLAKTAKAHAFLKRRGYVTPEDVRAIGMDVLRHRVIVTYEAEAEEIAAEDVVRKVLNKIEVP